jgi:hypothetical protein
MSCEKYREDLIGVLESTATPDAAEAVRTHLDTCEACCAETQQYRALRARLEASAAAAAQPALENQVMARVPRTSPGVPPAEGLDGWISRLYLGARAWRLGLGTAGLAAVLVAAAVLFFHEPSQAWSIEQSIAATRPFQALHLRGTLGGASRLELWARTATNRPRSQRLLMRIMGGPIVWTEGNATHYYQPGSGVVYTDDALTAGFNPWPGPRLLEMAKAAGPRTVDTRWRFPNRRSVVVEFSLLSNRGPMSARLEFDTETKLLVGLQQWDNMERRGVPGFESDDITFLPDLPNEAFSVDVPAGVRYQPKDVEVAEPVLGLLSLEDAGIPTPGLPLDEASRRIVAEMWQALLKSDLEGFKRLCPITRSLSGDLLKLMLGGSDDPDAVVEVVTVEPGVQRGHSRLGPVSVVTSRVRHRDGGLYDEKIIVQHRLTGSAPSCVIYSPYGQPYRLE